jgi:DUF1365 family protein
MEGHASRLYQGLVVHTRLRPRQHRLTKRIPMVLFDLDETEGLARDLKLLAIDRFGLLSLEARHHLDGDAVPLKAQVERRLAAAGIEGGGPIRLLCMPAVLGQVFNPISLYFCHRRDGGLAAILYEVNNTFGGRHCYLLPVAPSDGEPVRHGCAKAFHVSPFMDMDLAYAFMVSQSDEKVSVGIQASDARGPVLRASFAGEGEPLTDRALFSLLLGHPLLMLEVLAAIHWQAVMLLAKGLRLKTGRGPQGGYAAHR